MFFKTGHDVANESYKLYSNRKISRMNSVTTFRWLRYFNLVMFQYKLQGSYNYWKENKNNPIEKVIQGVLGRSSSGTILFQL